MPLAPLARGIAYTSREVMPVVETTTSAGRARRARPRLPPPRRSARIGRRRRAGRTRENVPLRTSSACERPSSTIACRTRASSDRDRPCLRRATSYSSPSASSRLGMTRPASTCWGSSATPGLAAPADDEQHRDPVHRRVGEREQRVDDVPVPGVLEVDDRQPAGREVVAGRERDGAALVGVDDVVAPPGRARSM